MVKRKYKRKCACRRKKKKQYGGKRYLSARRRTQIKRNLKKVGTFGLSSAKKHRVISRGLKRYASRPSTSGNKRMGALWAARIAHQRGYGLVLAGKP